MSGLILTRRGFLGSCIALAAAPAIIRLESLMPLTAVHSADWRNYVREVMRYMINDDEEQVRWDIRFRDQQYHVDAALWHDGRKRDYEKEVAELRKPGLQLIEDILRHNNVRPGELQMLPLPQGINWARNGVPG